MFVILPYPVTSYTTNYFHIRKETFTFLFQFPVFIFKIDFINTIRKKIIFNICNTSIYFEVNSFNTLFPQATLPSITSPSLVIVHQYPSCFQTLPYHILFFYFLKLTHCSLIHNVPVKLLEIYHRLPPYFPQLVNRSLMPYFL